MKRLAACRRGHVTRQNSRTHLLPRRLSGCGGGDNVSQPPKCATGSREMGADCGRARSPQLFCD